MNEAEELAKKRFMTLNLVRLLGLFCVMFGIANATGKLLPGLSPFLGYLLIANGIFDFFLLPNILRKSWQRTGE